MKKFKVTFDNVKYKQPLSRRDWYEIINIEDRAALIEFLRTERNLNPFYLKIEELKPEEIKALLKENKLPPYKIAALLNVSLKQVQKINEELKY